MTLIADGDVPDPVIQSLQAVRYPIARWKELGLPLRPDRDLMASILPRAKVLVTRDTGIPSQAYLYEYAQAGLTVVVMRWRKLDYQAFQQMVKVVLVHGEEWERIANRAPSVISVNNRVSRAREWSTIPESITGRALRLDN